MRRCYIIYFTVLSCIVSKHTIAQNISFSASLQTIYNNSNVLELSEKQYELTKSMHKYTNSLWFPRLTALGSYTLMSNDISVTQEYSSLLSPFDSYFQTNFITQEIGKIIYNFLGDKSFTVPISENEWATADVSLIYPIFTGGKRLYANNIGKELENIGLLGKSQTKSMVFMTWVELYYGLQLGIEYEKVKNENFLSLQQHYNNVVAFEVNGIATPMDVLAAKVAMEEAEREWCSAKNNVDVLRYSFCQMLNSDSNLYNNYNPSSPLFVCASVPPKEWFMDKIDNAPAANIIKAKKNIAQSTVKINTTEYFPTILVFGKQTLASYNVSENLVPRTMVGATFTWNLFDGLAREHKIKQSKIEVKINEIEYSETTNQLRVAINKTYSELENALKNINTLTTTLEMAKELVRTRKAAYSEGLTTSTEVIDAENTKNKIKLLYMTAYYQYDIMLASLLSIIGMPQYFEQWNTDNINN